MQQNVFMQPEGKIRKKNCGHHQQVDWHILYVGVPWSSESPGFRIEKQRFKFVLTDQLRLYRRGPLVVDGPRCRYYLGLKRNDGAHYYKFVRREIDLGFDCPKWTQVMKLRIDAPNMHQEWNSEPSLGPNVVFLRVEKEPWPPETELCIHGFSDMSLPGIGTIEEEECSHHKQVEWKMDYNAITECTNFYPSPVFRIEKQKFFFEMHCDAKRITIRIYRRGPTLTYPVRWWMGVRQVDGSYHPEIESKLFDNGEWEVWQEFRNFSRDFSRKDLLSPNGQLTFFLRTTFEETPVGPEYCCHDVRCISPRAVGSIQEESCSSYEKIMWYVDYEPSPEHTTSPIFSIGDQIFFWSLCTPCPESSQLRLYRMGPTKSGIDHCWLRVRRDDHTYYIYGSSCGKVDFKDEASAMWVFTSFSVSFKHQTINGGRMRFAIDLLMEQVPIAVEVIRADNQIPPDHQYLQDGETLSKFLTFRVKDKDFKLPRAVLCIRVPVFEAMLSHDCVESRTSVVQIKDCEPDVFEHFFNYILSGHLQGVTGIKACALFVIADKYLVDELKTWCICKVKMSLSDGTFTSDLELALLDENNDLLRDVFSFFEKNGAITKTPEWHHFCSQNPDGACFIMQPRTQHS